MSILDNQKFELLVCDLFYNQNMTQKEISEELGVSRPQICRLLAHAKSSGLVTIHLNYPNQEESLYEQKLQELYGLNEVFVYDIGSDANPMALDILAQKSVGLFHAYIKDNSRVGIMAGRSVAALINAFPSGRSHGLEFVPLVGGTSSEGRTWFANSNAQLCAEKTGGKYYLLNAPAIMSSAEARLMMEKEDGIRQIIDLWGSCDTVLLGIGTAGLYSSASLAGSFRDEEIEVLRKSNAKASICCSYLDPSGKEIHNSITERFIGASVSQIANAKKIAVAIGSEKAEAIRTALISDSVDVLITSLETAKQLVIE